jgi:putative ABC transport system ATP-binding protein
MSADQTSNHPNQLVLIQTQDLSRVVDGQSLVDRVSLSIHHTDVAAIVGPSGAGKSSFLRLLNRLDEPTAGTVIFKGQDYRHIPPRELRQQVGMVMQFPFLFPGTIAENIRFGPRQRGELMDEQKIEQLLEQVSLPGYAARDVQFLSGGEAQRVSLARTLANNPQVLLLDEPTSSLDEAAVHDIEQLLQAIIQSQRLTCVIVTHDMAQASRLAHKAFVLEKGQLVRQGPVQEIIDAPGAPHV